MNDLRHLSDDDVFRLAAVSAIEHEQLQREADARRRRARLERDEAQRVARSLAQSKGSHNARPMQRWGRWAAWKLGESMSKIAQREGVSATAVRVSVRQCEFQLFRARGKGAMPRRAEAA